MKFYPEEPIQPLEPDPETGKLILNMPFSDECGPITPPFRHPQNNKIIQGALLSRQDFYHGPDAVPFIDGGSSGWEVRYDLFNDQNHYRKMFSSDWLYDPLPTFPGLTLPVEWSSTNFLGHLYEDWLMLQYQCPSGVWADQFNPGRTKPEFAGRKKQLTWIMNGVLANAYGDGDVTETSTRHAYDQYPHTKVCDWVYSTCFFVLIMTDAKRVNGIIPLLAPLLLLGASTFILSGTASPPRCPRKS